jgi:hypothetical protein
MFAISKSSGQLDPRVMTSRSGKTTVAGKQRGVECFGKGDINGVIGCKIVP